MQLRDDVRALQTDIAALARGYHDAQTAEEMARNVVTPQERIAFLRHLDRVDVHGFDGEE